MLRRRLLLLRGGATPVTCPLVYLSIWDTSRAAPVEAEVAMAA